MNAPRDPQPPSPIRGGLVTPPGRATDEWQAHAARAETSRVVSRLGEVDPPATKTFDHRRRVPTRATRLHRDFALRICETDSCSTPADGSQPFAASSPAQGTRSNDGGTRALFGDKNLHGASGSHALPRDEG
jgi:hypothetical protein